MKKFKLLVAPLLSVAFLASCGGGNTPSDDVKFSVQETSITPAIDRTAVIHLDWTPSGDVIEFSNFTFTLTNDPITTYVTPGTAGDRPLAITILFSSDLLNDDEGKLKFHYNDKTIKKEGDAEVKGIAVKIPPVTEKRTLHFSGINCVLKDKGGQVISSDVTVDKGTKLTYFIDGTDGYLKPKDNQIDFKITDTTDDFEGEHSYNPDTGEVSVTLTENVTIFASGEPDVPGTFDEIELPKLGYQKNVTLHAQDGKIYIQATNASEALSGDDWLNIICELQGESQQPDSQVFSDVDITIDGKKVTPTYGTATGPIRQYWYVDIENEEPTQDNLYIILTLNEEFASKSGRIMKPSYTGEVSCVLWNQETWNKQEQITIDYQSITKTAS